MTGAADVKGIGVDLAQIPRLRRVVERWDDRFLRRVFTDEEIAYCRRRRDPVPHLAARFAAKEAALKALGTGWGRGAAFTDVEVLGGGRTAPRLSLHGTAARLAAEQRLHLEVSLSHDGDLALAVVLAVVAAPPDAKPGAPSA
jgi:holo-[acyl-carrier protein] synthase